MNEQRIEIAFVTPLHLMEIHAPKRLRARLTVMFENFSVRSEGNVMYTLPVDHAVAMQVSYVDVGGHPAKVDGAVTWNSSDETLATVEPDPSDSTMCRVLPTGELGQVQITATADADLGEGTRELITTADIEIVGGEAVAGTITPVGAPIPV